MIGAFHHQVEILFLPARLNGLADLKKHVVRPCWIFDADGVGPVAQGFALRDFAFWVVQATDQLRQLLGQSVTRATERARTRAVGIEDRLAFWVTLWFVLGGVSENGK